MEAHRSSITSQTKLSGFKSLFLKTKGIVFVSASSPGECSYSYAANGSILLNEVLKSFVKLCDGDSPTWQALLLDVKEHCFRKTVYDAEGPQNLIFHIE